MHESVCVLSELTKLSDVVEWDSRDDTGGQRSLVYVGLLLISYRVWCRFAGCS